MSRTALAWREDLLKSLAPPELRDDIRKTIEFLTENGVGFAMESVREYLFMQGYCLGRVTSTVTIEKSITRLSMAFDPNDRTQLLFPAAQVGKSLDQRYNLGRLTIGGVAVGGKSIKIKPKVRP